MSLNEFIGDRLNYHHHELDANHTFVHADFLGECYSTICVHDPEIDVDRDLAYQIAEQDIVEEIIGVLVENMCDLEEYTMINTETHSARLITLSKTEVEESELMGEEDVFNILDNPEPIYEAID